MKIGLTNESRKAIADKLGVLLANEFVLNVKTRKAHWNVQGLDFLDKHKLFEAQYEQYAEVIDDVAERIRILGFFPPATAQEFLNLATLSETSVVVTDSKELINNLLAGHEEIVRQLRAYATEFAEEYGDDGSADFVIALMQDHEKTAWFLRAHLG